MNGRVMNGPRELKLDVPSTWHALPIEPFDRPRQIDRYVTSRLGRRTASVGIRRQIRQQLASALETAWQAGAVLTAGYVDLLPEGEPPALVATVTASVHDADSEMDAGSIVQRWRCGGSGQVSTVQTRAGVAARLVRCGPQPIPGGSESVEMLTVRYAARVDVSLILLQCQTPNVTLARPFIDLFDGMAATLELS